MPAAVVKGIIVSISLITALGVAALESPQVQAWLEQQRQRLVELLRSIGEELDPQSRRAAEAFAYEGRTPATDDGLRREASGSREAAATATGRSLSFGSTVRRIPVQGPKDPDAAEERRRKGREYLAKRNQEMYELKQRKKAAKAEGANTPPTPTSFDSMVDGDGRLRLAESKELPSVPASELVTDDIKAEMQEIQKHLKQSLLAEGESSTSNSGWNLGSHLANPFSDEYALDRSETPKPPVPPKVALETEDDATHLALPGSFTPRKSTSQPSIPEQRNQNMSYEEQMAIALSLSEAEAAKTAAAQQAKTDDSELRAAIEASLKDLSVRQNAAASKDPVEASKSTEIKEPPPLVDLTPAGPSIQAQQPAPRGQWETFFDQEYSPNHEPLSLARAQSEPAEEDELYRVTPNLTHARLASLNGEQVASPPSSSNSSMPYDPVREAAGQLRQPHQSAMEASFYSAASFAPSPASTRTMDHETPPQLIDVHEEAPMSGSRTPVSRSSFGFRTDSESDSDTFASASAAASRDQSRPRSEISNVEVVELEDDSDVDLLSEEGDGVATPDSWSEIGSRDGESEMEDELPRRISAL